MALRLIVKVYFRLINLLIKGRFRQFIMEYKMGMRLMLSFTVWDIGYLVNCPFYKLRGLRERKIDKFIENENL